MPCAAPNVDALLRSAIEQKRLIRLVYRGKPRIVEPHDYGVHNGSVKLLGYQVGGSSGSPLPNWRWMEVNSMADIHLLDRTFSGWAPNSFRQTSRMGSALHESGIGRRE